MRSTIILLFGLLAVSTAGAGAAVGQDAERAIGRVERLYEDTTRSDWSGADPRPLATTIWYPADVDVGLVRSETGEAREALFREPRSIAGAPFAAAVAPHPLIVLSHGTGGSASMLSWLGERLAGAGYVVAAVDHHGNTARERTPSAAGFTLWWERATDVSRVIDGVLADPEIGSHVDSLSIGAAGFSLGGYTVLAVGGAITSLAELATFCRSEPSDGICRPQPEFPDLPAAFELVRDEPLVVASLARHAQPFRDPRVRAVYAIAPVTRMFTEPSLLSMRLPVRIVVGTADQSATTRTNGMHAAERIPGAGFRLVENAGHYTFLAECTDLGRARLPDLCADAPGIERRTIHDEVAADAIQFFDEFIHR